MVQPARNSHVSTVELLKKSSACGHVRLVQTETASRPSPICTAARIRRILSARRARSIYFEGGLFADPAWDMLLELYLARLVHRRLSVSGVCSGSGVPPTTALRWIATLVGRGYIERRDDPMDRRRVFLELSEVAARQMEDLVQRLPEAEVII